MADMPGFGTMDLEDRGGPHDFAYPPGPHTRTPGVTPSQTVGPFFAYALTPGAYGYPFPDIHSADIASKGVAGARIELSGQVFDANGAPVHDALVEIVQADSLGIYADAPRSDGFTGFGRCGTGARGPDGDTRFRFRTVKPGATQEGAAPFITVILMMRGLLNHMITRVYFAGDAALETDPVLAQVPEARRKTLIAEQIAPGRYRFDIRMQGPRETVFFDV